ncbi:MAG: STAS domain-containing protein [Candidatus Competibacterales bacterium]
MSQGFSLTHESHQGAQVVHLQGRLDSATVGDFEQQLLAILGQGHQAVVLNFAAVNFVSSAGLRVLLMAFKRTQVGGGRLALAGLSDNVHQVFDISGFSSLFEIYLDLPQALEAVA